MGMIKRGAEVDLSRAAVYFVRWWREEGGLLSASLPLELGPGGSADATLSQSDSNTRIQAWGFDFQWELTPEDTPEGFDPASVIQDKMERCIDDYLAITDQEEVDESNISQTQVKKRAMIEEKEKRRLKHMAKRK